MALIVCKECGKEFSNRATACPHCGCPNDNLEKASPPAATSAPEKPKKGGCSQGCLVLVGLFFVLAVVGGVISSYEDSERNQKLKGCNSGKAADCEALLDDSEFKDDNLVTNTDFKSKFSAREERRKEANARSTRFYLCERALKESLRDPDSLKVIKRDRVNLLIEYSATNGFGGRVRNVMNCETLKNLY